MVFSTPSSRFSASSVALLVLAAVSLQSSTMVVDAHGYLTTPRAEFFDGAMPTKYSETMTPCFPGKFNDNPQANVDTFTKAFKDQRDAPNGAGFKTLRAMLEGHGRDCGDSNPDASRKAIPADGKVVWQNPDTGEGFVASHTGPCEIWLDDERVFSDENCAGHFTSKPTAELPVDFSTCTKDCTLRFFWLALHEPTWQIYKNCVPLTGNGGTTPKSKTKSLESTTSNAYNAPSETPSVSPSPSPSSEPSPSPSPSPSVSATSDEYSASDSTLEPTKRPKCDKIRSHARQ